MLAPDYRIVVVNNTGVQVDSGLVAVGMKEGTGDGSGGISWTTDANEITGTLGSNLAAGSSATIATVTDSTALMLIGEAEGNLSTNTATPDGDLEFYLETSTDGGSNYNRPPAPIALLNYPNSSVDKNTNFAA